MAMPSPAQYQLAAQEAEARATQYRQAEDWPSLLSLRLRMAARYPRFMDPFIPLVNDYLSVVQAMHSQLPLLAPLAAGQPSASPTVRADAATLDQMQARLMQRLEAFAGRRGIQIHCRHRVRPRLWLATYGPCLPWSGQPGMGAYVVSPFPRRVPAAGRGGVSGPTGRPRAVWQWPRQGILLSGTYVIWRPAALAYLLVQLEVFMGYHRHRLAEIDRVVRSLPAGADASVRARCAAMRQVAREQGTPTDAVHRAEARGATRRGYSRLLVWMLRDELRTLQLPAGQPGE